MPTEDELSGAISQQRQPRPSPTQIGNRKLSAQTLMLGYGFDPELSEGSLKPPIFLTSTFAFENAAAGKRFFEGVTGKRPGGAEGLIYSRFNGPNQEILEDRLAVWEDADDALAFSSGMAAIATLLLTFVRPGDCVVHSGPLYAATETLIAKILGQFGVSWVDFPAGATREEIDAAIASRQGQGPGQPDLSRKPGQSDQPAGRCRSGARRARRRVRRPTSARRSRSTTPSLGRSGPSRSQGRRPRRLQPDQICRRAQRPRRRRRSSASKPDQPDPDVRNTIGTICDPNTAWMLLRSLETLELRMDRAGENAAKVCDFLRSHPKVEKIGYLGFLEEGSRQADIYKRHCTGAGSTFSLYLKGGEEEAFAFLDALQIANLAVSLGGTETLASAPAAMTHLSVPDERKKQLDITDNLVRISIGCENADDLIADFANALNAV